MKAIQDVLGYSSGTEFPLLVATGTIGLVTILIMLLRGSRWKGPKQLPNSFASFSQEDADNWITPDTSDGERRGALRRAGIPTAAWILSSDAKGSPIEVYVLDRSRTGLRLAVQKAYPAETEFLIRPRVSADDTPWVRIVVRHCKQVGDYFTMGCEFQEQLPLNILLLFG